MKLKKKTQPRTLKATQLNQVKGGGRYVFDPRKKV